MITWLKNNRLILIIFIIVFIIYYPSIFVFYTNDDFFFLKISEIYTFGEFVNFFNLVQGPEGFGMYRPITTQVFYFLGRMMFNLNPLGLHVISFATLFLIIYLVYKLIVKLTNNKRVAIVASYLYGASATHFGHLYYLATFQELGMTFFVLLSCLNFIDRKYIYSFVFYVLAILSKETAVVTPFLICLICFYQKNFQLNKENLKRIVLPLIPFALCLLVYLLIRIRWYGFATGDTYIWDLSIKKLVNTYFWYVIWSFNIPESLINLIGPGFKINPTLFIYWAKEYITLFILFFLQVMFIFFVIAKKLSTYKVKKTYDLFHATLFSMLIFLISLLPVAFLPFHKFDYFLTLPLVGITLFVSYILNKAVIKNYVIVFFLLLWTSSTVLTVKFTERHHWITNGEEISKHVFIYLNGNVSKYEESGIVFVDSTEDENLPWSPTNIVKTTLSDQNFFYVFYPSLYGKVSYKSGTGKQVRSRQFLGY